MSSFASCGCQKNRLIISHIPQGVTRTDLYRHFQSTAQIHRLTYSQLQGKATITLHDPSSADFILHNEWTLLGKDIDVRKSLRCHEFCAKKCFVKSYKTKPAKRIVSISKYEQFKLDRDPFWTDVPHEKSTIVKKKRHKRTRMRSKLSFHAQRDTETPTMPTRRIKLAKQRKQLQQKTQLDMEPDLINEEYHQEPFHLYVKYHGIFKLEFEKIPSLRELKKRISTTSKVPLELQLLTYQGKLLRSMSMKGVWSADTIHLLVKGKGGMKSADDQPEYRPKCEVSNTSSSEEVRLWLLDEVKVPKRYIDDNEEIEFLTGKNLFSYGSAQELKDYCNFPLAVSKKILYFRDNPAAQYIDSISRQGLDSITSEKLYCMLKESFSDEKYLQIAQTLRDKEVDAYVILLCSDPICFALEFEIKKNAARTILSTLKQKISEAVGSLSGQSCAGQDTKSSHSEEKTIPVSSLDSSKSLSGAVEETVQSGNADGRKEAKGEESSCQAPEVKESVTSVHEGLSTDEGFLSRELGFERIEFKDQSHCQVCDLVAIHCAWNQDNPTILAKSFLFWILFEEKAGVKDKQRCKEFWEAICINTQLWIDTLKAEDRKHFKPIKSAGTFQYKCSKTVKLGRGAVMKSFSEVGPELRNKFSSHILIIHGSVDTKTSQCVNARFKKLCFRFNMAKKRHWILSPNGKIVIGGEKHEMDEEVNQAVSASGDGRNIEISDNYSQAEMEDKNNPCDGSVKDAVVKVDDGPVQATGQDEDNPNDGRDADVKVDDVLATGQGKNYCGDGSDASVKMDDMPVRATGQDEDDPGDVSVKVDDVSFQAASQDNNYPGDGRDASVKVGDASVPAKVNNKDNPLTSKGSDNLGPQMPREFKHDGSNIVYRKGSVLSRPESGSDMIIPSLEFKFFQNAVDQGSHVSKFLAETLRFACGCLNRRRNGTIYFGVADHYEREGKQYRHGEVAGFPIDDLGSESLKSLYTDKLDHAKRTYFKTSKPCKVEECISSPRFVLVIPSLRELPWYVMEVDVEPLVAFCEGVTFKVDMSKFKGKKFELFVRDGASTKGITDKHEEDNFNLYMNRYDEKRKQDEDENKNSSVLRPLKKKYLADELCNRLCRGTHPFDTSLWPILVVGKPTFERAKTLYESLSFVSNINWTAVFDFDDESFISGICKKYFIGQSTNVVTSSTFRYIPNPDQLRSELSIPGKTVYIFCNGRSDLNKPHLTGGDWENEYLASVKKSVTFLQEESIIPVGRALVIFLLLSSDTEGYLDLFKELKTFFSVENNVLLCEDETVFNSFKTAAVHSTALKDLERCSVVGMKWEQTNDVFNKLLGIEKKYMSKIPSSVGPEHDTEVDPQFVERLDCLSLLSSNECETKEFDCQDEEKQYAFAKDLKFYQGNQVEWWNFHFPGHVVERTCFEKLKVKVGDALKGISSGNEVVITISLVHEPGAGGTTLARNILWYFRKQHRCAVVTKLKDETASNIIDLWKYKEREENAQTVLLLIDSLSQKEMEVYELHRHIASRVIKTSGQSVGRTIRPVCVILVCNRDEQMQISRSNRQYDAEFSEGLDQFLDDKERKQFSNKIKELEGTSEELGLQFCREHFISFMVLHSNFNPEFIINTTHSLLLNMNVKGNEFKLLMCVALLSAFVMPSKCRSALAIPHECCTELMGYSDNTPKKLRFYRWEDMLERALKILLIIEPKEKASGKQIRMAHPRLAMAVISYVQEKCPSKSRPTERMSLADLTMAVFESGLLGSHCYAVRYVHDLIIEMLTKRKKEEYGDNEISRFSPVIEKICKEPGSSYKDAVLVMEKAFEILHHASVELGTSRHASIAQQVARLYMHNKEYVKAKSWAETAVHLNSKRSPFIHTLGHVHRKLFQSSTKKKVYYTPDDDEIKEAMDSIFKALSSFEKACWCEDELHFFACLDTIEAVNTIVKFVTDTVIRKESQKEEFLRFLIDETYVFEYISKPLSGHTSNFKKLFEIGVKAIHDLDKNVYFQTKLYASQFNDNFNQEHRVSRIIRIRLPQVVKNFCKIFGESTDVNNPPSYAKSKEMKDEWHRRCVVCHGANRLIGACNLVSNRANKGKPVQTRMANLENAFDHLQLIEDKIPQDFLNLITVNLATHRLTSVKICTPIQEMLYYCDFIIRKGNETQRIDAYMYTAMLLWPDKE